MYPVSDDFKTEVYAPSRAVRARVTFDFSDVTAKTDVTAITTSVQAPISDKDQLINNSREQSYNLVTYEPGRFKLDGRFCFADDNHVNNKEMGFVSIPLCGSDGTFSPYPTITFQFGTTHSSIGLTITFDALGGEFAEEFNITAYDSAGAVILSTDIAGNNQVEYIFDQDMPDYKKIALTIQKWCRGYRRARILEVDFGIVRTYTDSNIIKCSLIEELDLTTSKLPSAEFKFTVDNANREFNILNPEGFYKYLQQRQKIIAEFGVDLGLYFEYSLLGKYLLWEWTSDEGSLTATFTARTNLDLMSSFEYENLAPKSNYSLYQMAVDVFYICGISDYSIDTALQNVATNGLVEKIDCRTLLQMIAMAGCANIFVNREGLIALKANSEALDTAVDDVRLEQTYAEPQIVLDKETKSVAVTYWLDLSISGVIVAENQSVTTGELLKLDKNTLINTFDQASIVANWILSQKAYRSNYSLNWRGNPALDLNDVVTIESSYGGSKKAIITKNSIEYEGYLSAKMEARG